MWHPFSAWPFTNPPQPHAPIYPGQQIRLSASFTVANVPADPTGVIFMFKDPTGLVTYWYYGTDPIMRTDVGQYFVDLTPTIPGKWYMRWQGRGECSCSGETKLTVLQSYFP